MSIDVLIAKASVFLGKQIVQNMFQTKGSILHSLTRLYNLSYRLSILRETKLEEITKASANWVEKNTIVLVLKQKWLHKNNSDCTHAYC